MEIEKITQVTQIDLFITAISLAPYYLYKNYSAQNKDIKIAEKWWIGDSYQREEDSDAKICVENSAKIYWTNKNSICGVRPICYCLCPTIEIGGEIRLGNYIFKKVKESIIMCETVIGYSTFNKATQFINNWFHQTFGCEINRGGTTVIAYTIDKKMKLQIPVYKYSILFPTAMMFSDEIYATGSNYWTQNRIDEFTNRFVDKNGNIDAGDILRPLNVCPVIYFNQTQFAAIHNTLTPFFKWDTFVSNGRLFRILHDRTGIALCLNTVGTTCYTTAICDIDSNETSVFTESETYKVLDNWYKLNYPDE